MSKSSRWWDQYEDIWVQDVAYLEDLHELLEDSHAAKRPLGSVLRVVGAPAMLQLLQGLDAAPPSLQALVETLRLRMRSLVSALAATGTPRSAKTTPALEARQDQVESIRDTALAIEEELLIAAESSNGRGPRR